MALGSSFTGLAPSPPVQSNASHTLRCCSAKLRNMANLRIVTWNCGMALARKVPSLVALKPDIAVVQECSKKPP